MRAVVFLFVCAFAVAQDLNEMMNMPKYDDRYDYLDVDALFTNKRLVRNYVDCLINGYRCTPEGKALRRLLPEALRTKCVRCTERQKKTAVKIIKRLKYEYSEEWAKLASRWDPTGDFTRYFEEFLAKEHFNTIPGSAPTIITVAATSGQPQPLPALQPDITPSVPPTNLPLPTMPLSTPPRPVVLNRFGGEGELMVGSSSSGSATLRPMSTTSTKSATTIRSRSTTSSEAASNALPTRFPVRPTSPALLPPYSTAITLIDQIGYKIIRTTELVTDLLKSTVRAVVGR